MSDGRRVLLVLGRSRGGIGRHVADLGHELRRRGWEVEVTGPASVQDLGFGDLAFSVPGAARLRATAGEVDVVHAHGLTAGWRCWAGRRGRAPLVVTVHNTVSWTTHGPRAPWLRVLQQRLPHVADAVVAVSPEIAATLGHRHNVRVVPPYVRWPPEPREGKDVRRDLGVHGDAPVVVVPARLHPQKALPVMIEAACAVRQRVPTAAFLVVGEGPAEAAVRAEIEARGAGGWFRLLGFRHDIHDVMAAADVVALSSAWEGSPLSVQEAMALGRPVVTTAVGGLPDLVQEGVTGRLVARGDSVGLAEALVALLTDPTRATAMGQAARNRILALRGPEATVAPLEDLYRQVVACA